MWYLQVGNLIEAPFLKEKNETGLEADFEITGSGLRFIFTHHANLFSGEPVDGLFTEWKWFSLGSFILEGRTDALYKSW